MEPQATVARKWYQKNLWIILLLVVFFPAGLFLMWRYSSWKETPKLILTAFWGTSVISVLLPSLLLVFWGLSIPTAILSGAVWLLRKKKGQDIRWPKRFFCLCLSVFVFSLFAIPDSGRTSDVLETGAVPSEPVSVPETALPKPVTSAAEALEPIPFTSVESKASSSEVSEPAPSLSASSEIPPPAASEPAPSVSESSPPVPAAAEPSVSEPSPPVPAAAEPLVSEPSPPVPAAAEPLVSEPSYPVLQPSPGQAATADPDWTAELDADAPDTQEITAPTGQTAYWTPKGKSYHFSSNCRTLSRSKTILSGSLQEALNLGKADPCNICAGGR